MGATVAAAAIMKKERELVTRFRQAHAVSPTTAKTLSELRIDEGLALRRLCSHAVIREAAPGAYYLDELSYEALRAARWRMLMVVLVFALIMLITMFFATRTVT